MSQFRFLTTWNLEAPIEQVWSILNKPEDFPSWWPGFEQVTVLCGDGDVGSVTRFRVRGSLGMAFDFTTTVQESQAPEHLTLNTAGDFSGQGEWKLRTAGARTEVTYIWNVRVNPLWLRLISCVPGSRWFLQRSHDKVMEAGGERLAQLLKDQP